MDNIKRRTATDAAGCTATDCATICVEDVTCFFGNSGVQKVKVCRNNNTICIDSTAVQLQLDLGDELGPCGRSMMNSNDLLQEQNAILKMSDYTNGNDISTQLDLDETEHKNAIVQVFSMNGHFIQKMKTAGRSNFDVNTNAKGIFVVQLIIGNEKIQKRVLVSY